MVDPANGILSMDGVHSKTADAEMANRRRGDKIRISIRPERFSFSAEPLKDNIVDCIVENITFLGSVVRIQVKIGNTKFNMDTFNNPFLELPAIGAQEKVMCSKEAVLVLESA